VRERLTEAAVAYPDEHPDKIQMFDLLCYNRLMARMWRTVGTAYWSTRVWKS